MYAESMRKDTSKYVYSHACTARDCLDFWASHKTKNQGKGIMLSMRKSACLLVVFMPLTGVAAPVTYEFSGALTGFNHSGDDPFLPPPIPYGTEYFGTLTIDDSTPSDYEAPGFISYRNPVTAARVSFGPGGSAGIFEFLDLPLPYQGGASSDLAFFNDIEYLGNPPYDQFNFGASLNLLPGDAAGTTRAFFLDRGSFDTSLLPAGLTIADPWPVSNLLAAGLRFSFSYQLFDADGNYVDSWAMESTVASLRQVQTSVPEPATLSLLGAGLLMLGFRRRGLRR